MKKTREEYIDLMAKDLKEWSATIDEFAFKASRVKGDLEGEFAKTLLDLREKRDLVDGRLRELTTSAGDVWAALQSGVENAKHDLRDAFEEARAVVKKAA